MSPAAKWELMKAIYDRYHKASRKAKSAILDEFSRTYGCHRKHAIRVLSGAPPGDKKPSRRRRPPKYEARAIAILEAFWEASGYLWSKRLKAALPDWMPWIKRRFQVPPDIERQLWAISAAQIDRRLKDKKLRLQRRIYGTTKPGRLLKHQIPIKTDWWDVREPGFLEVDLVSHSGDCAEGDFGHTLNVTDILTGWVERRCVLGKGQEGVRRALDEIRKVLPFALRGIDCDNGGEFINDHLFRYCRDTGVQFTRSRPYKKDDNAHVEQKNWTHVRKLLGYLRYEREGAIEAINELYRTELGWFQNLFQPSVKLMVKTRVGSRPCRRYDEPRTPLNRVIESKKGDLAKIEELRRLRDRIDPFHLAEAIDRRLDRIGSLASKAPRPTWFKKGKLPANYKRPRHFGLRQELPNTVTPSLYLRRFEDSRNRERLLQST